VAVEQVGLEPDLLDGVGLGREVAGAEREALTADVLVSEVGAFWIVAVSLS
jgi:hypothetical protein